MIANRPIASVAQVDGLQAVLDAKLPLAGGTMTGQIAATQASDVITPRIAIVNQQASGAVARASVHLTNSSTGVVLYVVNSTTGIAISIANSAGGYGAHVANAGSGRGFSAESTSTGTGIYGSNSGAGRAAMFRTLAAATGNALTLDHAATASGAVGMLLYDATDKSATGTLFRSDHYGPGYSFDFYNRADAGSAFVVHQYSQRADHFAVWVDNCGSQAAIHINNTENATHAPGQIGTGKFLQFQAIPSTGQPLAEVFYVSGEGVMCAVPKASAPATLADGMLWVEGADAAMVLKARINGATHTVTTVAD